MTPNNVSISLSITSKQTVQLIEAQKEQISCDLAASWTVQVGDMDQVLHLWRYTGGFEAIDQAKVSGIEWGQHVEQTRLRWSMMIRSVVVISLGRFTLLFVIESIHSRT